jgi:hypothetical protein
VAFVPFFFTTLLLAFVTRGSIAWSWFWVFVTAFVAVERVWSVKRGGWRSVALAGLVLPEIMYDFLLHGVYVKALTDIATGARGTWDSTHRVDLVEGTRSPWRRGWNRIAAPSYVLALLVAVVGLALLCFVIGVAWYVIGTVVLAGAAMAALRLSGLDPFGLLLGTGEPASTHHSLGASDHQGFGGLDVPADTLAARGGEGVHHFLSGGAGIRSPQASFSAAARQSREATTAWLRESRRAQRHTLAEEGRVSQTGRDDRPPPTNRD